MNIPVPKLSLTTLLLLFIYTTQAQDSLDIQWHFTLNQNGRASITKMESDAAGNTCFIGGIDPHLNEKLGDQEYTFRYCPNVAVLGKLDAQGTMTWCRVARPEGKQYKGYHQANVLFNEMAVSPLTGSQVIFGQMIGVIHFPKGNGDTLKAGCDSPGYPDCFSYFMASYSAKGELEWFRKIEGVEETPQLEFDRKGNLFLVTAYKSSLKIDDRIIVDLPKTHPQPQHAAILKLDAQGYCKQKVMDWEFSAEHNEELFQQGKYTTASLNLTFDNKNNMVLYGGYAGHLKLSKQTTLYSRHKYTDSRAGFIAVYNDAGKLLWQKKLGGMSGGVSLQKPVFNNQNEMLVTGNYGMECFITNGETEVSRVKAPTPRAGRSMMYAKFDEKGNLKFVKYRTQNIHYTHCWPHAITIDEKGYTHIFGSYTDSLEFSPKGPVLFPGKIMEKDTFDYNGKQLVSTHVRYKGGHFYSAWKNDSLVHLQDLAVISGAEFFRQADHLYATGDYLVFAGVCDKFTKILDAGDTLVPYTNEQSTGLVCKALIPLCSRIKMPVQDSLTPAMVMGTKTTSPAKLSTVNETTQTDTALALFNSSNIHVKAFPNPFSEQLTVEINNMKGNVQIDLVNEAGQIIYSQNTYLAEEKEILQFNFSNLSRGVYFFVLNNGTRKTIRLIKTN